MVQAVRDLIQVARERGATALILADQEPARVMQAGKLALLDDAEGKAAVKADDITAFLKDVVSMSGGELEDSNTMICGSEFGRVSWQPNRPRKVVEIALRVESERLIKMPLPYASAIVERVKTLQRGQTGGLFLVGGPVCSGRTVALHQLMLKIAQEVPSYIVGLHRPTEYAVGEGEAGDSVISQRSVGEDLTLNLLNIGRAQIVFIDSLRAGAEMYQAIELANRGHIVIASMSGTTSSVALIDQLIRDAGDNENVRAALARALKSVIAQKVPWKGDESVLVCEVMHATPAIQNLIRENKTYRITSAIQTGHKYGMNLFDEHLVVLVKEGKIDSDVARAAAYMPEEVDATLKATESDGSGR